MQNEYKFKYTRPSFFFHEINSYTKHILLFSYIISVSIFSYISIFNFLLIYAVPSISFQTFLYRHLKLSLTLENQYVIDIHLMRWLTNFYDFRFKWTATVRIGIHTTKVWLMVNFKNAIWMWGHFKRTICNKFFCFKLGKNVTETYGMLQTAFGVSCMNRASVFEWHKRFTEARESVRDDERCGRSKGVNTPELIGQRVRVRVTMLRF